MKKVRMLQGRVHRRKEVALPPFGGSILHARPAEAGAKPAQRAKGGLELGGGRASREPWRCFFPLPSTDQHHHPGPCKRKCQMPNPYPYPWGKIKEGLRCRWSGAVAPPFALLLTPLSVSSLPGRGKVILFSPDSSGVGKEREKAEVLRELTVAALPAGCAHCPRLQAGGYAPSSSPREACAAGARADGCAVLASPSAWSPDPSARPEVLLRGAPRWSRPEPGRPGAPLRAPCYVPVLAFPLQLLTCLGSPAWSQPPPAEPALSRAPSLSGTLGQMWGGLSRAIGLGHCFELASRISPGFAAPLWAGKRGCRPAPYLSPHIHCPLFPRFPSHPAPRAQASKLY